MEQGGGNQSLIEIISQENTLNTVYMSFLLNLIQFLFLFLSNLLNCHLFDSLKFNYVIV
jgi:hypothetical protein